MNLEVFLAFALLACVLAFLGYYTKPSIKVLAVLGFATLFFLGLALQLSGVQERTGDTATIVGNSTVTVYNYTTISDNTSQWLGRWLSIVSALSVALVFASNKEE